MTLQESNKNFKCSMKKQEEKAERKADAKKTEKAVKKVEATVKKAADSAAKLASKEASKANPANLCMGAKSKTNETPLVNSPLYVEADTGKLDYATIQTFRTV